MKLWVLVLLILVLIAVGYFSYKLIPFEYTPNIPPLLQISFDELNSLDEKLQKKDLTETEKQEIEIRKEEIFSLLKQFFGKDIRYELV